MKKIPFLFLTICLSGCILHAQDVPYPNEVEGVMQPFVHDPVIMEQEGVYYMFHTGPGITAWKSEDLKHWDTVGSVFPTLPEWMHETISGFSGHIWAPDISYHDGTYYLFYSVSAFGKNTSCIGLATNVTLCPDDPDFKWVDHGIIIQSFPGLTNWNAIDPNIIEDDEGTPYMAFGSFWGGLQIVELTPDRKALAEDWTQLTTIASRNRGMEEMPVQGYPINAGGGAIEAPFIYKHGGFYYLFASIDYCCRGPKSTYKMIVGRSEHVKGPYLDQAGVSMLEGGGSIVLTGDENWYGVGHNAVCKFEGQDYLIFHAYDAADERGRARLRIEELSWDWPNVIKDTAEEDDVSEERDGG